MKSDDLMSYDYMMGFLMGKALSSHKVQNKPMDCYIEMSEEEIKMGDDLVLRDMNEKILYRLHEQCKEKEKNTDIGKGKRD